MRFLKLARKTKGNSLTSSEPAPFISIPPGIGLVHITHQKAASQWFRRIFRDAFGPAIVEPDPDGLVWFEQGIVPGKAYPCVYLTTREWKAIAPPENIRRCVVIRDLRDTAVSAYFSLIGTHRVETPGLQRWRLSLNGLEKEEGLMLVIERFLPHMAMIQKSWIESGETVLQVEDFFDDPLSMFTVLFNNHFELDVSEPQLKQLLSRHNFEAYAGGRQRGIEDENSHFRKGVAGDWKAHFTPANLERFMDMYGELIELTGYEAAGLECLRS